FSTYQLEGGHDDFKAPFRQPPHIIRLLIGSSGRLSGNWYGRSRSRRNDRIDPAGVDAGGEAFGRFRVDAALAHDAAERLLDVPRRTPEPVVEIEMPERGVEIVAP